MATKTYICPECRAHILYDESVSIDSVALEHIKECAALTGPPAFKRITDVVPPEVLKGDFIAIEDVLDKEILVREITWHPSSFKEDEDYLSLTVEVDGEERKLNTSAGRVVEVFKAVKPEDLPIYCSFEKVQLPGGRRVYRVK